MPTFVKKYSLYDNSRIITTLNRESLDCEFLYIQFLYEGDFGSKKMEFMEKDKMENI